MESSPDFPDEVEPPTPNEPRDSDYPGCHYSWHILDVLVRCYANKDRQSGVLLPYRPQPVERSATLQLQPVAPWTRVA